MEPRTKVPKYTKSEKRSASSSKYHVVIKSCTDFTFCLFRARRMGFLNSFYKAISKRPEAANDFGDTDLIYIYLISFGVPRSAGKQLVGWEAYCSERASLACLESVRLDGFTNILSLMF